MGILLVPVPVFTEGMAVDSYLFRYRLGETDYYAGYSPILEALRKVDANAFSFSKPLLLPVNARVLLSEDFSVDARRLVLLMEPDVPGEEPFLGHMDFLRDQGFRMACTRADSDPMLARCDYLLLDSQERIPDRRALVRRVRREHKGIQVMLTGLGTLAAFEASCRDEFDLYEGAFFTDPITQGPHKITPLKGNLIRLLNVVRDENFEFDVIAEIVRSDPALSVSLMRFINSPYVGLRHRVRTIHHAVVLLGQWEVRKWVTAAVFKSMGADRPGELTRLSLIRAKFAENLAPLFGMGADSQSLFLMGLFSCLDVMLGVSMDIATSMVLVSNEIHMALVEEDGPYYPVLSFIKSYERADWDGVLGYCDRGRNALQREDAYDAYMQALAWYNELISRTVRPLRRDPQ